MGKLQENLLANLLVWHRILSYIYFKTKYFTHLFLFMKWKLMIFFFFAFFLVLLLISWFTYAVVIDVEMGAEDDDEQQKALKSVFAK